jgi:hypothetical protein
MIIAHTLIHAVASIGYTLLATHVSWLPCARSPGMSGP